MSQDCNAARRVARTSRVLLRALVHLIVIFETRVVGHVQRVEEAKVWQQEEHRDWSDSGRAWFTGHLVVEGGLFWTHDARPGWWWWARLSIVAAWDLLRRRCPRVAKS